MKRFEQSQGQYTALYKNVYLVNTAACCLLSKIDAHSPSPVEYVKFFRKSENIYFVGKSTPHCMQQTEQRCSGANHIISWVVVPILQTLLCPNKI